MSATWTPTIGDGTGTLHEQLVRAVRHSIAQGALLPGTRMPPHRELASRLGIGVGTVTKAYAEAERLGLLTSTVGRGTFVADHARPRSNGQASSTTAPSNGPIDLSLNLQVHPLGTQVIAETLSRLPQRPDLGETLRISPPVGIDWHRKTLAMWFRQAARFDGIDWRRLMVTTGAQHAMSLVVDTHLQPGETVLTEAATFAGFRALVANRGGQVTGVAMDGQGIVPEALAEAIERTGARLLYTIPTIQNPTTRTMSRQRRAEMVAVAREYDLTIIEDDVYGPFAYALDGFGDDLVPLAQLAPERTFYISSASKTLAMGVRVGVLVAPDEDRFGRCADVLRATSYSTSALAALLVCQAIVDGGAGAVRNAIAHDATRRTTLARRVLGETVDPPSFPTSLHAWLPMSELQAERVANGALRRGVTLTPPTSYLVDGSLESGLRLCLNGVSYEDLERALKIIRAALADEAVPTNQVIV